MKSRVDFHPPHQINQGKCIPHLKISRMLVPVTFLLPRELANMLQRSEPSSKNASTSTRSTEKIFNASPLQSKQKNEVKKSAAIYKFTPRLLGGRTPSQLFLEIEEQQKVYCQLMSFDQAKTSRLIPEAKRSVGRSNKKNKVAKNTKQDFVSRISQRNPIQKSLRTPRPTSRIGPKRRRPIDQMSISVGFSERELLLSSFL